MRTQTQVSAAAKNDRTVAITVRLPSRVYQQLAERAEDENRSVNQEAIRLIRSALADSDYMQKTKDALDRADRLIADLAARMGRLEKVAGKPRPTGAK